MQPLDVGFNAEFKKEVAAQFDAYMKAHMEKWTSGSFTASERRILITRWVAEATQKVMANAPIRRIFEKCGISVPIDGSLDELINIRGLENYSVEEIGLQNPEEIDFEDDEDNDNTSTSDMSGSEIEINFKYAYATVKFIFR